MPSATYTIEIAWTTSLTGLFLIGTSTIGGTDVLKGDFNTNDFDDVTEDVLQTSVVRGRTDDLGQMIGGRATLVLTDTNGKYNPFNVSSELYPNVKPMRPVRIKATYDGTTHDVFYGYIQRIQTTPFYSVRQAVIECADLFSWLQASRPVIASTGATTTGAAIGAILDECDFNELVLRNLDTGDSILDFSADGTKTALELITNLLTAERGVFYISKSGVATYEDRNARYVAPRDSDQSELDGRMQLLTGTVDVAQIFNEVRVTKESGTEQTATNAESISAYARRVLSPISTAYLADDAAALALAGYLVHNYKDPKQPLRVDLYNAGDTELTAILERDLSDRVGVNETLGGTSGSFFIEAITHQTSEAGTLHKVEWLLSKRPDATQFLIGYGIIGTDYIAYM